AEPAPQPIREGCPFVLGPIEIHTGCSAPQRNPFGASHPGEAARIAPNREPRPRERRLSRPSAAARAPRAATQPLRRRAWLRIFLVRCSLPCDPPAGGNSCNRG